MNRLTRKERKKRKKKKKGRQRAVIKEEEEKKRKQETRIDQLQKTVKWKREFKKKKTKKISKFIPHSYNSISLSINLIIIVKD